MLSAGYRPTTFGELREVLRADRARNEKKTNYRIVAVFRIGQLACATANPVLFRVWRVLNWWVVARGAAAEIPAQAACGPGLRIHHRGVGIVMHRDVVLGENVELYHRVTIGVNGSVVPPVLGDGVYVGAGATIAGPITVGAGAKVGAGAVVVRDVAPGDTVAGVPATVVRSASVVAK